MKFFFRVYVDAEGETHFEDIDVDLPKDLGGGARPSRSLRVGRIAFGSGGPRNPDGEFSDWHHPATRQFVVTLTGEQEYRVSDGQTRRLPAGGVMLLEDVWGKGHQSRAVTDEERLVMYITLLDDLPEGSFQATDAQLAPPWVDDALSAVDGKGRS